MGTDVIVRPRQAGKTHEAEEFLRQHGSGKADVAHIVLVPKGEPDQSPQAYVMRSRIEGFPITALCGYTWVPNKMASRLPVCPTCEAIFKHDPKGHGDRGDLPDE